MKLAGCIMIMAASVLSGYLFAEREKKRLAILTELNSLLQKLVCGIRIRIPVDEIAKQYMENIKPKYICGNGREEIYTSLSAVEHEGLCRSEAKMCMELFLYIAKSTDAAEIERQCIQVSDYVSESLSGERAENGKKKELYMKLGIFLGLLVCIIVI